MPQLDRIAFLDLEFDDLAGVRAGDFDDRLFRFQFDDALVGGDFLALVDEDVDDIAAGDVFTQLGKFEFGNHVPSDRNRVGIVRSIATFAKSLNRPWPGSACSGRGPRS